MLKRKKQVLEFYKEKYKISYYYYKFFKYNFLVQCPLCFIICVNNEKQNLNRITLKSEAKRLLNIGERKEIIEIIKMIDKYLAKADLVKAGIKNWKLRVLD